MDGAAIAGAVIGVVIGLVLLYNIYWAIILVLERVSGGHVVAPRAACLLCLLALSCARRAGPSRAPAARSPRAARWPPLAP